ncbi:uncharacterized protein TNCV_3095841 [Trichonephila clavipes]|nr:uncharacterized protein TNCV_3095841 [Trichonephila clavipes]
MKGSEVKRELEEKGFSFKNDQGEKHTNKTNKCGPLIRSIPSSWFEKSRRIKRSKDEMLGYKISHEPGSGRPERKIQKGSEHRKFSIESIENFHLARDFKLLCVPWRICLYRGQEDCKKDEVYVEKGRV